MKKFFIFTLFLFFNSKFMDSHVSFGVGNDLLNGDDIITDANIIRFKFGNTAVNRLFLDSTHIINGYKMGKRRFNHCAVLRNRWKHKNHQIKRRP